MFKKLFLKHPWMVQFIKFALIGVLNTFVDLAVLNLMIWLTGVGKQGMYYTLFKAISFTVAVINSYIFNKYWVFKGEGDKKAAIEFSQFLFVSVIGAIVNVTVASLFVNYMPIMFNLDVLWPSVGALAGTAFGLIWNFIGYKLFVFKKKSEQSLQS